MIKELLIESPLFLSQDIELEAKVQSVPFAMRDSDKGRRAFLEKRNLLLRVCDHFCQI